MEWISLEGFPPKIYGGDINARFVTDMNVPGTLQRIQSKAFRYGVPFERSSIGQSRENREIWGLKIGMGRAHVSITAGAHSDEPAGPMAAMAIAEWLVESPAGQELCAKCTFYICPNVNPDGTARNQSWFSHSQDPLVYIENVFRELPGEDVEFGYPTPDEPSDASIRPENFGVAQFLTGGGPYILHASLHGMAYAEGAWFLIGKNWIDRTSALRQKLSKDAAEFGMPLHDIDRHGEKGFTRIAQGFCTTPESTRMRDYFLAHDDPKTASKFHLNSMEFVQAMGGDPLVMVSEIPIFLIGNELKREQRGNPPVHETLYVKFREAVSQIKAFHLTGNLKETEKILQEFDCLPVPWTTQINLIARMVFAGISVAINAK
jgi:hypothetical protein